MFLNFFLLQAQTAAPAAGEAAPSSGPNYQMFIMLGVIIVVFYFFMIRPQQRRQKQEQKMRDSLAKGDRVVTIGGIHGKIVAVEDTTILIEVDNGVKLKMDKSAVKPLPAEPAAGDKNAKK